MITGYERILMKLCMPCTVVWSPKNMIEFVRGWNPRCGISAKVVLSACFACVVRETFWDWTDSCSCCCFGLKREEFFNVLTLWHPTCRVVSLAACTMYTCKQLSVWKYLTGSVQALLVLLVRSYVMQAVWSVLPAWSAESHFATSPQLFDFWLHRHIDRRVFWWPLHCADTHWLAIR